ncbi:MAG: hypothetical protein NT129_02025 [Candidatus Aenigmarchaeota archaeon]|nr:hypothetical protein [Candidatus Aenigmarchaeota archaeon]
MFNLRYFLGIFAIISIVFVSGCTQPSPTITTTTTTQSTETTSTTISCNTPSDCGSFYDCINSKCVKIIPPELP